MVAKKRSSKKKAKSSVKKKAAGKVSKKTSATKQTDFFKKLRKRFTELYAELETPSYVYDRVNTGIDGLDALLSGGFPSKATIVVAGPPGSGKTLFALEFIYKGLLDGEQVLFISMTEPVESVKRHMDPILSRYGIDKSMEKHFHIAYYTPYELREMLGGARNSLLDYIDEHSITRLAIDPISALAATFKTRADENEFTYKMFSLFQKSHATILLTVDRETPKAESFTRWDFMADVLIELNFEEVGFNEKFRFLDIVKARDTEIKLRKAPYLITPYGVRVFEEEVIF